MEGRQQWNWSGDPLQLPRVRKDEVPTVIGDRRPGAKFCASCGSALEGAVVTHGYWSYCSIECAIRTEREGGQSRRLR